MKSKKRVPARVRGIEHQPLMNIQWVPRTALHGNSYNPNHVAPIEMELLKISIKEDGWTQPIVARPDGEIIDGWHRWLCSDDPEIAEMTGGEVPVVYLVGVDIQHQIMSTIRHNRARGSHGILKMADIVRKLIDEQGMSYEEVMLYLQMEWEEVDRLYDRSGMMNRASKDEFSKGWVPE